MDELKIHILSQIALILTDFTERIEGISLIF